VECHTRIPRSRKPVAVEDGQAGDESSYSVSPWSPRGNRFSDSEKAEALGDTLETQFQSVADPAVPAIIEMVDVALRSYFQTPASEPKLTNPDEVKKPLGVSRSVRLLAQTVYPKEP